MSPGSIIASIDTGSTFTDGYFRDGDRYWIAKVETTPHDFTVGFLNCLAEGARQMGFADLGGFLRQCELIRFCTTLTTNALVQGRGTRLGLLTGRALAAELAETRGLVEAELVSTIDEEVDSAGVVQAKPQRSQVVDAARGLLARGARALVVALPRAAREPSNEREVQRILDAEYPPHLLGSVPVTLSHQVSRRPEDGPRTIAALLNARVHALLARSLREAEDELRARSFARPLLVVHADGGCGRVAKTRALDTYASGPAAVAYGATKLWSDRHGKQGAAIAIDIGGTTTDLTWVTGPTPRFLPDGRIGGHRIAQPLPEISSLGLGGGSIARMAGGNLSVGPDSAGALPGPACFDLGGTDATVTDACLVLGFLAEDRFLGGRRRLRADLARRALASLTISEEPQRTAALIKDMLETQAAESIRAHRGTLDLAGTHILALGGGGGLHAAAIAAKLGLRDVDVFATSPVFGAFGASTLDVVHVYQASLEGLGGANGRLLLGGWFRELVAAARRDAEDEGFCRSDLVFELVVEHQPAKPGVPVAISRHEVVAEQEVVACSDDSAPRMAWLRARIPMPRRGDALASGGGRDMGGAKLGAREVVWALGAQAHTTEIVGFENLPPDARLTGPCLVESRFSTLAVPPGWTFSLEANGWMHLHL